MNEHTPLLPCPFCGELPRKQRNRGGGLYIFCSNRELCVCPSIEGSNGGDDSETIAAWNTRAQSPAFDAMKTALHDFLGRATDGRDVPEWLRDEVVKLDAALKLAKEAPHA